MSPLLVTLLVTAGIVLGVFLAVFLVGKAIEWAILRGLGW